jgi:hypothetical protein
MEGGTPGSREEAGFGAALMRAIADDGMRPEQEEDSARGGSAWGGAGSLETRIGLCFVHDCRST